CRRRRTTDRVAWPPAAHRVTTRVATRIRLLVTPTGRTGAGGRRPPPAHRSLPEPTVPRPAPPQPGHPRPRCGGDTAPGTPHRAIGCRHGRHRSLRTGAGPPVAR